MSPDEVSKPKLDPTLSVHPGAPPDTGRDGAAPSTEEPLPESERYRVLSSHARGGLGEVFLAVDGELERNVALKRLQSKYAGDADHLKRFLHEARVAGSLEHPGIVPVYGMGECTDGQPFYAMRFIAGKSLEEAIREYHAEDWSGREDQRSLALRKLLARLVAVCEAVAYAHSRGVLHRDLKPSNIMLGPYGETLVVDWGLAKSLPVTGATTDAPQDSLPPDVIARAGGAGRHPLADTQATGSGKTLPGDALGTPAYMSPEQAAGQPVGPATDIYSLGATLYAVVTGVPPHEGSSILSVLSNIRVGKFRPPRKVQPNAPWGLEAIVLKAMALDPASRYASCRDLADDVERWLADEPLRCGTEPWRHRWGRYIRRRKALWQAAAASLAVGVAVIISTLVRSNRSWEETSHTFEAILEANVGNLRANVSEGHPALARPLLDWGNYLTVRGRPEEAEPVLREAVEIRRRHSPAGSWRVANAESYWGESLLDLGRIEEASVLLKSSYEVLKAESDPDGERMKRARKRMANLYRALGQPREAAQFE